MTIIEHGLTQPEVGRFERFTRSAAVRLSMAALSVAGVVGAAMNVNSEPAFAAQACADGSVVDAGEKFNADDAGKQLAKTKINSLCTYAAGHVLLSVHDHDVANQRDDGKIGPKILIKTGSSTGAQTPSTVSNTPAGAATNSASCSNGRAVGRNGGWSIVQQGERVVRGTREISRGSTLYPDDTICPVSGNAAPTTTVGRSQTTVATVSSSDCQVVARGQGPGSFPSGSRWLRDERDKGVLSSSSELWPGDKICPAALSAPEAQSPESTTTTTVPAEQKKDDLHGCPVPSRGYRLCAVYEPGSPKGWSFIINSTGEIVEGEYGVTGAGRSVVDSDGVPNSGGDDITPMGTFDIKCWAAVTSQTQKQKEAVAAAQAEVNRLEQEHQTTTDDATKLSIGEFLRSARKTLSVRRQQGKSCQSWPASPGLRNFGRFSGVMGIHNYGTTRAESHGCLRTDLADEARQLGVGSVWLGVE